MAAPVTANIQKMPKATYPVPMGVSIAEHLGGKAKWVHLNGAGKPLNTIDNLRYLLRCYGIRCSYNRMTREIDIDLPYCNKPETERDIEANCNINEIISLATLNGLPKSEVPRYMENISANNSYHPVEEWIESKEWDEVDRLEAFFKTVKAVNEKLKRKLMFRWLIGCVAALYEPHFENHGVLVFSGEQGKGKTRWIKSLVPSHLNAVLDGAIIDPADKDSVTTAISHWIVELGELDGTFRKADIARLKAFVTRREDKLRRPYQRADSSYKRRTAFFASVNEEDYLVDKTGNRRWWTVAVKKIDHEHNIDTQQLFAQAKYLYEQGEQWWLTEEELEELNAYNELHEATDPVIEAIHTGYDWEAPFTRPLTTTQVLKELGFANPSHAQIKSASKALKKLAGEPTRKARGRFYDVPRTTFENSPF